jgi:hypothetical protein
MQPAGARGRRTRLALMPVSWATAALTVYVLLLTLAMVSRSSISGVLHTDTIWPLAALLPGLLLGKVVGLMVINVIALCIPRLRQIFENEEAQTGCHGLFESDGRFGESSCRACDRHCTWLVSFPALQMRYKKPNQPTAPNPVITVLFQIGHPRRRVGDWRC